jgi:superfamily I DNA/RNA helicase
MPTPRQPVAQAAQALRAAAEAISAADEKDDAALPGLADIKAPQPSLARLIDFVVFYETMELAKVEPDSPLRAHAFSLAKLTQDEFLLDAETYLEPLFGTHGFGKFRAKFKIVTRPATVYDKFTARGTFLRNFFATMAKKADLLHTVFAEPRLLAAARKLLQASKAETAPEALQVLGSMRSVGGMTRLRAWVKEAVVASGVVVEAFDEAVATAGEAQDIGQQIADTDLGLQTAKTPAETQELQGKRDELIAQLDVVAAQSPNPEATIAMAAQAAQPRAYRTKVGEKLKMNPVQENAMMQRGKVVIAAGAGSGKTRVLSGKVVWHINEQGASPESVLATSFTRKSAAELKDRIIKAGADIEKGAAADGFGTTHSIAAKLIKRFKPGLPQRKGIGGEGGHSQGRLYKMAIAQVKMYPSGAVTSKPDPNETFFTSVALSKAMKDFTPTKKQEAPPVDPSTAVPFSEAVDQGLAWLKTDDARRLNDLPWLRAWRDKPATYDLAKVCTSIFTDIKNGRLRRENMSPKQQQRFMEVMKTAGINFVPGVSASVRTTLPMPIVPTVVQAAAKKGDFSQYDTVPANQWFNLGAVVAELENQKQSDPKNDPLKDFTPGNVGRHITKWKGSLITPGMAYAGLEESLDEERFFAAAYAAYEWIKNNDPIYVGSGDPDDLLINFSKLAVADSNFREGLQRRFKYVLVDEAQDQNPAQHLMFGLISGYYDPATQKPRTDGQMTADTYAMIGDDKQAIYEFRGAAPTIYIDNSDTMGGNFKTEFLDTNYRSGKQIVETAGNLISHNRHQIPMACVPFPPRGEGAVHVVQAGIGQAGYETAAKMVADQVKAGVADGDSYKDYGVGCRTNKEAFVFTSQLLQAGITFRSKFNPLTHRNTQAMLNWVVLANADETNVALMNSLVVKCLSAPGFGINQKTLEDRLQQLAADPKNKGKSYLQILEEGGWNKIYLRPGTDTPTSRNTEVVKPYVDALRFGRGLTGSPSEVIVKVLNEIKGADGLSMLETLIKKEAENEDSGEGEETEEDENTNNLSEEDMLQKRKEDALAPLSPVIELAKNYGDLDSFIGYIRDLAKANDKLFHNDGDPKTQDKVLNAVNVDTVHGWKGLEVKHMYIPMAGGTFPFFKGDIESERRLGYVAITRGEDSVTVFSILKPPKKEGEPPLGSIFLSEMNCKAEAEPPKSVVQASPDDDESRFPSWASIAAVAPEPLEERRGKALRVAKLKA